ncbi:hypothetical protein V865_001757 [Kwoniella europaea PYCC6329]|uniref:Uncharacterized protein n=1 Tax=Kwoniella europaea PYCC6329 TaxID=1423913 RepID=A0AAX4KAY9_9TREE
MTLCKKAEVIEKDENGGSLPLETLMVKFIDRSCPRRLVSGYLWQDFLISLSGMKKLRTLECLTCVHVPLVDGIMFVPERNTRGSTYEHQLNRLKDRSTSNHTPSGQVRMAMTGAAQAMIDHCPSLEKGYFWQWLEQDDRHGSPSPEDQNEGKDDEPNWKRWTWSGVPTASGKKAVIEPWVEEFSVKWTLSTDGEEGRPEDDD